MKRTIKIHVAGQPFVVRSDAEEEYVAQLAEQVGSRINALKGSRHLATQADAVLVALQLADELLHERRQHAELRSQVRERVQRVLTQIAQPHSPSPGTSEATVEAAAATERTPEPGPAPAAPATQSKKAEKRIRRSPAGKIAELKDQPSKRQAALSA